MIYVYQAGTRLQMKQNKAKTMFLKQCQTENSKWKF